MKYAKKKKKSPLIPILLAVVIVLALILAMLLLNRPEAGGNTPETTGPVSGAQQTEGQEDVNQNTEAPVAEGTQAPAGTEAGVTEAPGEEETTATEAGVVIQTDPKIEETEPATEDVQVKTPFCTLYFPGQWSNGLEIKITEEEWNTAVDFFANVDGKQIRLFTLHFGGEAGDPVGIWEGSDGVMMDITMEFHELELDDSWSAEQTDYICAMQEAVNYVVEKLAEEDGFTALDA